ncbi:DUF4279 domain-containing protein [Alkalihalobacillus sp. 1P02AB]|uniref:DUF4279 domain-containing protein n=1 Tax=Alkalihalobacillus sp. 1P02AB TaxID=3132260 RepID=UPI0039A57CF0
MEKSNAMVYFWLAGDSFPVEEVTRRLGIIPTESYRKGDVIRYYPIYHTRIETAWKYGTDYQETVDIENQFAQIISPLQMKKEELTAIINDYSIEAGITIVLNILEGQTPALFFTKEVIQFAAELQLEIDVDLYAYPYKEDQEDLF